MTSSRPDSIEETPTKAPIRSPQLRYIGLEEDRQPRFVDGDPDFVHQLPGLLVRA